MFILRWVCWVLSLFPWPLWRKIHSSPYLHISALLTCCQHWANSNSSQSLSWLPTRCPQQGGCFQTPFFVCLLVAAGEAAVKHSVIPERRSTVSLLATAPSRKGRILFSVLLWCYLLPIDTQTVAVCFPHRSKKLEIRFLSFFSHH